MSLIERCHNCQEPAKRSRIARIPDHIHELAAKTRRPLEKIVTEDFRHVAWDRIQYEDHNGPCGLPCEETLSAGEKAVRGRGRYHDGSTCPCMEPAAIEARRRRDEAAERRRLGISDP